MNDEAKVVKVRWTNWKDRSLYISFIYDDDTKLEIEFCQDPLDTDGRDFDEPIMFRIDHQEFEQCKELLKNPTKKYALLNIKSSACRMISQDIYLGLPFEEYESK